MPNAFSCGSWNRTNIKTFRASRPTVRRSRNLLPSSGGRNRTYGLLIQSQASLPTATTPEKYVHLKSVLRKLSPPRQFGRLVPLPLGQGHTKRKERESNPQGSSLDCFRDSCHRQLACPSVTSCGDRNRTCVGALNRRPPVPTRAPPQLKSAQLDLNQRSPASGAGGIARLSHTPIARAPSGSRTRTSAMARQ
jgi:hypothetical protein